MTKSIATPNQAFYNAAAVGGQVTMYAQRFDRQVQLMDALQPHIQDANVLTWSDYIMAVAYKAARELKKTAPSTFQMHEPQRVPYDYLRTLKLPHVRSMYVTLVAQVMAINDYLLPCFGEHEAVQELYANACRMRDEFEQRAKANVAKPAEARRVAA